jgi:hypothetical protein
VYGTNIFMQVIKECPELEKEGFRIDKVLAKFKPSTQDQVRGDYKIPFFICDLVLHIIRDGSLFSCFCS